MRVRFADRLQGNRREVASKPGFRQGPVRSRHNTKHRRSVVVQDATRPVGGRLHATRSVHEIRRCPGIRANLQMKRLQNSERENRTAVLLSGRQIAGIPLAVLLRGRAGSVGCSANVQRGSGLVRRPGCVGATGSTRAGRRVSGENGPRRNLNRQSVTGRGGGREKKEVKIVDDFPPNHKLVTKAKKLPAKVPTASARCMLKFAAISCDSRTGTRVEHCRD